MDDLGLLGFENSSDLFKKLQYDYERLKKEKNNMNYMNFIICAYHLKDWINYDTRFNKHERRKMINKLYKNNLNLFKDMTNRGKHYKLIMPRATITKDEFKKGFSWTNFKWSEFTWRPCEYLVEQDGKIINLDEECERIFSTYKEIFESINIK